MFDLNLSKSISAFAEIKFNSTERHNLDACIKVILYIIGKISNTRREEMETAINSLFQSYADNPVIQNIVKNKIGHKFE